MSYIHIIDSSEILKNLKCKNYEYLNKLECRIINDLFNYFCCEYIFSKLQILIEEDVRNIEIHINFLTHVYEDFVVNDFLGDYKNNFGKHTDQYLFFIEKVVDLTEELYFIDGIIYDKSMLPDIVNRVMKDNAMYLA